MRNKPHPSLKKLAQHIRDVLGDKKCYLVFAHNGTGKTRLSSAFKDLGKIENEDTGEISRDTLYYNAFTEDLFTWNNDLDGDVERFLGYNDDSKFFAGLQGLAIEESIREFMYPHAVFRFDFDYDKARIVFSRDVQIQEGGEIVNKKEENIKISRGEESLFTWCFFLAIVRLAIDGHESYNWVKYIYIDDPISSLDDNNVIMLACQLAGLIEESDMKFIISTHHALFFNVMQRELRSTKKVYLYKESSAGSYVASSTDDASFFHHVSLLKELKSAADTGNLYPYHFNGLRSLLEKSASFHGYVKFTDCLRLGDTDEDERLYNRMVNLMSHGGYSMFEPKPMVPDNIELFREILARLLVRYNFNEALFLEQVEGDSHE